MSEDIEAMFSLLECMVEAEFDRDPAHMSRLAMRVANLVSRAKLDRRPAPQLKRLESFLSVLRQAQRAANDAPNRST